MRYIKEFPVTLGIRVRQIILTDLSVMEFLMGPNASQVNNKDIYSGSYVLRTQQEESMHYLEHRPV
jgi:hypothetical protein